jgi:peroxiredoxin
MAIPTKSKAPDFNLKGVDGKTYSLASFKDKKAVALIFSCNHCPVVKAYEGRMVAIQREYEGKGATLVAINSNDDVAYPDDSFENMVKRAKEKGFNFPYLRDASQEAARAYAPERTPEVFLLNSDGVVVYHGRIDDSQDPAHIYRHDLKVAFDEVLAGKAVSLPEASAFGCSIKWKK